MIDQDLKSRTGGRVAESRELFWVVELCVNPKP